MSIWVYLAFLLIGFCWTGILLQIASIIYATKPYSQRRKLDEKVALWVLVPVYASWVCWLTLQLAGVLPVVVSL